MAKYLMRLCKQRVVKQIRRTKKFFPCMHVHELKNKLQRNDEKSHFLLTLEIKHAPSNLFGFSFGNKMKF